MKVKTQHTHQLLQYNNKGQHTTTVTKSQHTTTVTIITNSVQHAVEYTIPSSSPFEQPMATIKETETIINDFTIV